MFLSLRLALIIIPECVAYFGAAFESLTRIETFLDLAEVKLSVEMTGQDPDVVCSIQGDFVYPTKSVSDEVYTLALDKKMEVKKGKVIGIVGSVSGMGSLVVLFFLSNLLN